MYIIKIPSGWLGFTRLGKLAPTSIALEDWPAEVYAGRLTIWGHRIRLRELPRS